MQCIQIAGFGRREDRINLTRATLVKFGEFIATKSGIDKNSLEYIGKTHVYRIKGPYGTTSRLAKAHGAFVQ